MSLSIFRIEMFNITKLSPEDFDAIQNSRIYHADDGTYFIEQETLDYLELEALDPEQIKTISPELLQALKEEHQKQGDFNFILS